MRSDLAANADESGNSKANQVAGSDPAGRLIEQTCEVYEVDADRSHSAAEAWSDIIAGISKHPLWRQLAALEIKQKYSGSSLGAFWITATSGAFAVGIGIAYSQIFGIALQEYLPYVGIGIVLWGAISAILNEGTQVYISASGVIKQVNLPLSIFVFKTVYRNIIAFFYRFIVIIALVILLKVKISALTLLTLVGIATLFFAAVWASILLGILSIRFRDVPQVTSALLTFSFFLTPVFWKADRLGDYEYLVNFNPFYHFIEIIRSPLLGTAPQLINYVVSSCIAISLCAAAIWIFSLTRRRIPYWC